jgi:ribosomal protein S18 acetylase RimI-like enzyme
MQAVTTSYSIEKPSFKDFNALIDLWQEQYEYHHQLDPTYYVAVTGRLISTMREYVRESIEREVPYMLVAKEENNVVGFITFKILETPYFASNIKKSGQIIELFVDLKHRKNGIGTLLTQAVEKFFKEKGISYVIVQSSTNNPGAANFYHAEGYTSRQTQHFKSI